MTQLHYRRKMYRAIKKTSQAYPVSRSLSSHLRRHEATGVRFRQVTSIPTKPDKNMDKTQNPKDKTGNVMSHSFGEGYASRSDEEGFGGIYEGNQASSKIQTDKFIHENHPAYDKTQGSEVAEKEKARNQTNAKS